MPNMRLVLLAVEDDALVRVNLLYLAEAVGFDALEAASADEAITILQSRDDINVLFTDINMPGAMEGLALARLVRERWAQTAIIVSSGNAAPGADELPTEATFLPKPCYGPRVEGLLGAIKARVA